MILNSYIHEQLATAHRRDVLEAATRHRLGAQARTRGRHRFPSRTIRREEVPRPRRVASSLCGSARTTTP
jgi:hypothetical protein